MSYDEVIPDYRALYSKARCPYEKWEVWTHRHRHTHMHREKTHDDRDRDWRDVSTVQGTSRMVTTTGSWERGLEQILSESL